MQEKNKPLRLKPFLQSTAFCGPASLKIILSYFGKNYTEPELARLASATKEHGTFHTGLIEAAKKCGAKTFAKEKGTLKELETWLYKKNIPVLIGWYDTSGEEGDHYSVVYHISKHYIYMMDPATNSGYRKMSIKKFLSYWYDFEDDKNTLKIHRWFMTLWF